MVKLDEFFKESRAISVQDKMLTTNERVNEIIPRSMYLIFFSSLRP